MKFGYQQYARALPIVTALSLLVACGGGGGGDGLEKQCESGEERVDDSCEAVDDGPIGEGPLEDGEDEVSDGDTEGTVSGYVHNGRVADGKVEVFTFDPDGTSDTEQPGELVTETRTDADGYYEAKVVGSGPMVVRATEGSYTEDSSGEEVGIETGEYLSVPLYYDAGNGATAHLTYYSHLTTGLAKYLTGVQATEPVNAIPTARDRVGNWIGVNPVTTKPALVAEGAQSASSISPELRYGYLTAAISAWTERIAKKHGKTVHREIDSIGFAQVAYDDIRADGLLDGQSSDGGMLYEGETLNTGKMRVNALGWILKFQQTSRNEAGLGFDSLFPVFDTITRNDSRIFPSAHTPPELSTLFADPTIAIQDGSCPVNDGGTQTVTAAMTADGFPIEEATLTVNWWQAIAGTDEERLFETGTPADPVEWTFDVPDFSDSGAERELLLEVEMEDGFGRVATDFRTCMVTDDE